MAEGKTPVIHRSALERVLQRAAELHAAGGEAPETLSESDILAAASEVGISAVALKQALAEERMRVVLPEERGVLAGIAGPATFVAARQLRGSPAELLASIDRSMQREENLMERRRFPDRIVWGPRGGWAGALREFTRFDGRGFPLVKADEVSAVVLDAGSGGTHVRIEASLAGRRSNAAWWAAGGIAFGTAASAALVLMSVFVPVAVAAGGLVAAFSAWATKRGYQKDASAAQLAIEQTLDRLEFGEPRRKSLIDQFLVGDR
jgi:hypothetical protein